MEFFNQKEEVLDLVLTKRGKELFAQGNFTPYGYKFFDSETDRKSTRLNSSHT